MRYVGTPREARADPVMRAACETCGWARWECQCTKYPGECDMGSCAREATHTALNARDDGTVAELRPACPRHIRLAELCGMRVVTGDEKSRIRKMEEDA